MKRKKITQRQACIDVFEALGQDENVRENGLKARVIGDLVHLIKPSTSKTMDDEKMTRAACASLMGQDGRTFKRIESEDGIRWKLKKWEKERVVEEVVNV